MDIEETPRERAVRLLQDMMKQLTGRVPARRDAGELVDAIGKAAIERFESTPADKKGGKKQ